MAQLHYQKIVGSRQDTRLLWIPSEKHLYFKKRTNGKCEEWVCYQTILAKGNKAEIKCSSSVIVNGSSCSRKNIHNPHSNHSNHEKKFKDLISANQIKESCIEMRKMTEGLSISVPSYDIFTREIAK